MMMLTGETADRLGVKNRLDPLESILGGARYVLTLKEGLPVRIPEPDRTWMALAAYNMGMAHLEDARRLTASLGKSPDAWKDVKDVLPLLAQSAYQDKLKFGYARGGEARHLTENVRIYYDILLKYETVYQP
jgi:membrane-bound lytic murein transglycosylase F